jgi:propanediol dehydratase small subunit
MSIEARPLLRHGAAGLAATPALERSSGMFEGPDPLQMARALTEKYGRDALAFARERAARAHAVGDEIALDAWRLVIEATQRLLHEMADA